MREKNHQNHHQKKNLKSTITLLTVLTLLTTNAYTIEAYHNSTLSKNFEAPPAEGNIQNCETYSAYGSCSQCEDNYFIADNIHYTCSQCQAKTLTTAVSWRLLTESRLFERNTASMC
jgi:Zn finger protein HypA/HybF involved in hydrogenase expression